jgi:penicillin amidase
LLNTTLEAIVHPVTLGHTAGGVRRIRARSNEDLFFALGWVHGRDRGGQIAVSRIIAEGRICECLQDGPGPLGMDIYFRRLGLARDARAHIQELEAPYLGHLEAYARGVNGAWSRHFPWWLRLAIGRPAPFTPADVLLLAKLMSFAGLAEGQRLGELFIVEALRRGAGEAHLKALFPALDAVDVELIRGLRRVPELFPGFRADPRVPVAGGSNAWVVSGRRSRSGHPLLANDPHLEINRLPPILYEVVAEVDGRWVKGATIPGLPAFLSGRTRLLAWGVTYSCADTSDFFVERCREGQYLRDGRWYDFEWRTEIIRRRHHNDHQIHIHEGPHGVLEGDPREPGDYLSWNWVGFGPGGLESIRAYTDLLHCDRVGQAQEVMRRADIPTLHVVLADARGDIAYQFSGVVPRRRAGWSGLAPVAGWDPRSDWRGWRDPASETPSQINPESGYIVITNQAPAGPGRAPLASLWLSRYRGERITECLLAKERLALRDMQAIQYDVLSTQARRFLPEYLLHVPQGPRRELLEAWDLRYSTDSRAATVFENIHRAVVVEVFGAVLGRDWLAGLFERSNLVSSLAGFFDDVLERQDSVWLPAARRGRVIQKGVRCGLEAPSPPWGETNVLSIKNIFFGMRLPRLPGLNRGPFPLPGNHATPHQGSLFRMGRRPTSFAPCYHMVTDLGTERLWTNLPGGPAESPFSWRYTCDLRRWLRGGYKGQ